MLSKEEQAAFLESIERVRQSGVTHLGSTQGVSGAIGFIANLHRAVDKVVQQANDQPIKIECQIGCAFCCSLRVEATEPEIFLITRELKKWTSTQLTTILEKLHKHAEATNAEAHPHRTNCAFLENNLCSIYEVRPAACRKAHSLSAECCSNFSSEIPQNLALALDTEALMKGTSEAYQLIKLCASAHELCHAVLLAMSDESAEARWYNGEVVFATGEPPRPTGESI